MASIKKKGNGWYCQFVHAKKRYNFAIGKVFEAEARGVAALASHLLMRVRQGLRSIPAGADVAEYVRRNRELPASAAGAELVQKSLTLAALRDDYLRAVGGGAVEANTLSTTRDHFAHLVKTLGAGLELDGIAPADLKRHIERRQGHVAPVTLRKELARFKTAWAWAETMGRVPRPFPVGKLVYYKEGEKLPFVTWAEVQSRLAAGGDPGGPPGEPLPGHHRNRRVAGVRRHGEGAELALPPLLPGGPLGMRRSELLRALPIDLDFVAGVVIVREKKRVKGQLTTRRVPLTRFAEGTLREWCAARRKVPVRRGAGHGQCPGGPGVVPRGRPGLEVGLSQRLQHAPA